MKKLEEHFRIAVDATRDFQAIFETGIYDAIDLVESEEVLKALDWLIVSGGIPDRETRGRSATTITHRLVHIFVYPSVSINCFRELRKGFRSPLFRKLCCIKSPA